MASLVCNKKEKKNECFRFMLLTLLNIGIGNTYEEFCKPGPEPWLWFRLGFGYHAAECQHKAESDAENILEFHCDSFFCL